MIFTFFLGIYELVKEKGVCVWGGVFGFFFVKKFHLNRMTAHVPETLRDHICMDVLVFVLVLKEKDGTRCCGSRIAQTRRQVSKLQQQQLHCRETLCYCFSVSFFLVCLCLRPAPFLSCAQEFSTWKWESFEPLYFRFRILCTHFFFFPPDLRFPAITWLCHHCYCRQRFILQFMVLYVSEQV